jgi:hypothetical protein
LTGLSYFYYITMNDNMKRMNLDQLIPALTERGLKNTASYFSSFYGDEKYTVEKKWIDKSFVQNHIGPGQLFKDLECEVLTWLDIKA